MKPDLIERAAFSVTIAGNFYASALKHAGRASARLRLVRLRRQLFRAEASQDKINGWGRYAANPRCRRSGFGILD